VGAACVSPWRSAVVTGRIAGDGLASGEPPSTMARSQINARAGERFIRATYTRAVGIGTLISPSRMAAAFWPREASASPSSAWRWASWAASQWSPALVLASTELNPALTPNTYLGYPFRPAA
jgi:hypothetical protein